MRTPALVIALACVTLSAACANKPPDPTKPIPWLAPKRGDATQADLGVPRDPGRPVDLARSLPDEPVVSGRDLVVRPTACDVPAGYEPVELSALLAAPEAYVGRAVQIAGPLGARPTFTAQACPTELPNCACGTLYFLSENGAWLGEPRVDIREPERVDLGKCHASARVPEADLVVVWGVVSPSGASVDVVLEGICDADALACDDDADCPAALACDDAGADDLCQLP